jgi:regulator of replication initiation timing
MDDQQWTMLIQELRDAINNAKDAQDRFQTNNITYNNTINDGFKNIQDTIHEIDGLIGQLTELITGLKNHITELISSPNIALNDEIASSTKLLNEAHETQSAAAAAMRDAIDTLKSNNEAMTTSIGKQDVAGLNKTMTKTTANLDDIKTRLQALLNKTPPRDQQNNPIPDDTEFELPDSDENITYGDLKRAVNARIKQITDEYGKEKVPEYLTKIYNTINAVNATQQGLQQAINNMPFDKNRQLQGGTRKRRSNHKITKKQRRARRNKTMPKQRNLRKGHRYTSTKEIYNKSNKRSIARS